MYSVAPLLCGVDDKLLMALALSRQPIPKVTGLSLWGPLISIEQVGRVWSF